MEARGSGCAHREPPVVLSPNRPSEDTNRALLPSRVAAATRRNFKGALANATHDYIVERAEIEHWRLDCRVPDRVARSAPPRRHQTLEHLLGAVEEERRVNESFEVPLRAHAWMAVGAAGRGVA